MDHQPTTDDCGCAPTARERRILWPAVNRRSAIGLGVLGLAVVGGLAGPAIAPAFAATYPSWEEVKRAKANQAAKAAQVTRIRGLISALTDDVAAKNLIAEQTADAFYVAQQAYFEAAFRAEQLQAAADAQAETAKDAADKAGRLAAQVYRDGGDDTSLKLFFTDSSVDADDLLARLGTMDRLISRNNDVYTDAITARDAAQGLTDQAEAQRVERDRLQKVAEQAMIAAQKAAEEAQAALEAQQTYLGQLQAQLAALTDTTAKTVASYEEGERMRKEAERLAREEAERKAREQAEAAAGGGNGGGGSGGAVGGSGWARPSSGWITSGYGPRNSQCGNGIGCSSSWHLGTDLAAGCGSAIYAASAGTVTMAWPYSGYGNYIRISHGGGVGTGYGHLSRIFVSAGQWVGAGQLIGAEGNTGNSYGCHLHFEVYPPGGGTTNPVPWMAARGVSL
ncbi:hypothetical protein GCM10009775_12270 [Microbacterium aoyamense]|uniref:M23ase beta-sheet core domain-containing protein n=1 Tax=Microbacterium aoyamense TaxID=344166 RepID=A0ABP5ASC7_9MICO|nr:peptidoglycan DD-metalloendopeptidase family protein [Microbacterium aoyamense]